MLRSSTRWVICVLAAVLKLKNSEHLIINQPIEENKFTNNTLEWKILNLPLVIRRERSQIIDYMLKLKALTWDTNACYLRLFEIINVLDYIVLPECISVFERDVIKYYNFLSPTMSSFCFLTWKRSQSPTIGYSLLLKIH